MERRISRPTALLPGQVVPGQAAAALPGEEVHSFAKLITNLLAYL